MGSATASAGRASLHFRASQGGLKLVMANAHRENQGPWPTSRENLVAIQDKLGKTSPDRWQLSDGMSLVAGCFICYPMKHEGRGVAGDLCWAAAVLLRDGQSIGVKALSGKVMEAYEPGLLALREGPWLEEAIRHLPARPHVVLVNATGRDHPRRAGLALHLGARLSLPTVGVTRNPLLAEGSWPEDDRGANAPLKIGDETVGRWLRTKRGSPPLAVHAAWRTDADTAVAVVMGATGSWRTPEPLRQARRVARLARAGIVDQPEPGI
jgi:deoxyribonuclease V